MPIEKEPFRKYRLDEEKINDKSKTVGVHLTQETLIKLEKLGEFLHQEKLSSVVNHCIDLQFAKLSGDDQTLVLREILFNNTRKNKRLGLPEVKPKFRIS